MYNLVITKIEPRSEEEKKQMLENRKSNNYGYNPVSLPQDEMDYVNTKIVQTLNVTVTDEEFQAIKKAVVEIM